MFVNGLINPRFVVSSEKSFLSQLFLFAPEHSVHIFLSLGLDEYGDVIFLQEEVDSGKKLHSTFSRIFVRYGI